MIMDSSLKTDFYTQLIERCLKSSQLNIVNFAFPDELKKFSDAELKSACEQSMRDALFSNVQLGRLDQTGCLGVIQVSISLVQSSHCAPNLPFILLEDMFECITVPDCETAFAFVENNIEVWRRDTMLQAGKNYLLRMCNNLLRRLSTSRNTVLCGRIHLFLAHLLPLDEKSALNIMGAFNLDNLTVFASENSEATEKTADEKSMEVDSTETTTSLNEEKKTLAPAVDYALYKKFWSLQDFFRNPNQCCEREKWLAFANNAASVLKVFSQHKLENVAMKKKLAASEDMETDDDNVQVYFAKNLTSEKLFDLQLEDINFRRHVLIQMLVLFQYIQMKDVKFKPVAFQSISDDVINWVNNTQEKVYALLEESPPNGPQLVKTLKHILSRELVWNTWKNSGCPSFVKHASSSRDDVSMSPASIGGGTTKARTRRAYIGDSFTNDGLPSAKRANLGNKELTTLWNIEPDNLKACRAENRRIFPEVKDFFQEASEQLDPGAGIEDEYKLILNTNYQWCALRLLARRSTLFFQPNSQLRTIPDFLKAMIEKTFNSKPAAKAESTGLGIDASKIGESMVSQAGNEAVDKSANNNAADGEDHDEENNENEDSSLKDDQASNESRMPNENEMSTIAKHIPTENLKDLAVQLDFKDEEIDFLMKEPVWCVNMLKQWIEREGEEANIGNLVQSLLDVDLPHIVFRVFPKLLPSQYRKKALEMLKEPQMENGAPENEEPMTVS